MSTATATKADGLRHAQSRLAEMERDLRAADADLQEARRALTGGEGTVAAVTEAEGRANALRGAADDLRATVARLQWEVNAEGEQARIRERVEAYCAQARESTAAIELYLALLLQLQEASRNVVEQEQRYNLRDHEVRRLTGGTPAPPADATPGLAWRAVEGAVQFHQDTWNALRQLRPVEPAQD